MRNLSLVSSSFAFAFAFAFAAAAAPMFACGAPPLPPPPAAPPLASTSAPSAPPSAPAAPPDAGTPPTPPPAPKASFTSKPLALPGATGPLALDYLAIDRAAGRVWIPAAGTGSVDVYEIASSKLTRVDGFKTAAVRRGTTTRLMGPSSATIGDGVVYVGNRATKEICAIDAAKLTKGACITLAIAPDGLQYVASTKELWATAPKEKTIVVLDASKPAKLAPKTSIVLEGAPEGYAIDEAHGVFFTNLEDMDKTVTIDVKTHKVTATWEAKCGSDGPRGLAFDARGFLFVACTTAVEAFDAKSGAFVGKIDTGAGVDNIDYVDAKKQLFVAAGKAATLTVASVDDKGALTVFATAPTTQGARNVVADSAGVAYVADPTNGGILVLTPSPTL